MSDVRCIGVKISILLVSQQRTIYMVWKSRHLLRQVGELPGFPGQAEGGDH